MYRAFYGLAEKPFEVTPDPRFLHLTPGHREALAHLEYGVQEHRGFVVLTGEVGTGKTTLLQALLRRLDGTTASAFIFNTSLSFDDMLEYALEDLGVPKAGESRAQRLFALNGFLIERSLAGQNTVLIIDEAQNLDVSTLEQVRLLSNLETPTQKLLQILLVGQPELREKLNRPELRQLKQRVGLRCNIPPLSLEETRDYIRARLRTAGARDLGLFTPAAIKRIAEYAGGIPRVVNLVCDHCLVMGYADQVRKIEPPIVAQAIEYLEEGERPRRRARTVVRRRARRRARRITWVGAGVAAALAVGLAGLLFYPEALAELPLGDWPERVAASVTELARSARDLVAP